MLSVDAVCNHVTGIRVITVPTCSESGKSVSESRSTDSRARELIETHPKLRNWNVIWYIAVTNMIRSSHDVTVSWEAAHLLHGRSKNVSV